MPPHNPLEKPVNNKIVLAAVMCAFFVASLFVYGKATLDEIRLKKDLEAAELSVLPPPVPRPNYFKDIALQAEAAYAYDVTTKKVLYESNADIPLPLASITKVMTALIAKEHIPADQKITIDARALEEDGESGLTEGELWDLEDIMSYTLMVSSNDGARSLANAFSALKNTGGTTSYSLVDAMNEKAKELGLSTMSFSNPTGLDIESDSIGGGYGTVRDVALLFEHILSKHPDLLADTRHLTKDFVSDTLLHPAKNTNPVVERIPNLLASKTGYTLLAGGNLAVALDRGNNNPVILVVLGSTFDGRFDDILRLASSTIQTYNESK